MESNEERLAALRASSAVNLVKVQQLTETVAALVDEEKNKTKLKKLDKWRMVWGFFMILIMMPAWLCAGVVEGESFNNSAELVSRMLRSTLHVPDVLTLILVWPITILAKVIPASSTWPFITFMVLGAGFVAIPIIVFTIFFGCRLPPYFRRMKSRIDPHWEEKENEGVIQQSAIRSGPFSSLIVFFAVSTLVAAFFIHPNIRAVIADKWVGGLTFIDENGRSHRLNAKVSINYIDPGYVLDLRPGVSQRTLFMEFSGDDLNTLKALGVSKDLFKGAERELPYSERGCQIRSGTISRSRMYQFILIDSGKYYAGTSQVCPQVVQLDVKHFNEAKLSIMLPGNKYHLESDLTRDSRWGFIERAMVESDFQKNPALLLKRGMGVQ
jgi:hypothetical protein